MAPSFEPPTVFTIGHSTLPIEEFTSVLRAYGVEQLCDVRTIPRSRHNPQFNADALADSLPATGIAYIPMPSLGGLRHTVAESPNGAWRNKSFRGYADYMQTREFAAAMAELVQTSAEFPTALMCAEAVPWRCHRSLIADALTVRDVPVVEILSEASWRMHAITSFAHVHGDTITYPPPEPGASECSGTAPGGDGPFGR